MRDLTELMREYRKTHQNATNRRIHMICVPFIVASTIGLGWLAGPALFGLGGEVGRWLNAGTVGAALTLIFYARLGIRPLIAMVCFFAVAIAAVWAVDISPAPLWAVAAGIWVAAWAAQIVGHEIEGAKPSFTDDMVFFLIGPLFILEELGLRLRGPRVESATARV